MSSHPQTPATRRAPTVGDGVKGLTAVIGFLVCVEFASGILQGTIRYEVAGDSLFVGTNRFAGDWDGGAAVLHFGSKDGSIPARPFLGADEEDVQRMLDVLERYFSG